MNHKEDCDIDVQACSTMDCTGLIPSPVSYTHLTLPTKA